MLACFWLIFKHKKNKEKQHEHFIFQSNTSNTLTSNWVFYQFSINKKRRALYCTCPIIFTHTYISYSLVDHFLDSPCNIDNPHSWIVHIFQLSIPLLARLDHQGVGKSEDIGQHGANARKHVLRNPL